MEDIPCCLQHKAYLQLVIKKYFGRNVPSMLTHEFQKTSVFVFSQGRFSMLELNVTTANPSVVIFTSSSAHTILVQDNPAVNIYVSTNAFSVFICNSRQSSIKKNALRVRRMHPDLHLLTCCQHKDTCIHIFMFNSGTNGVSRGSRWQVSDNKSSYSCTLSAPF